MYTVFLALVNGTDYLRRARMDIINIIVRVQSGKLWPAFYISLALAEAQSYAILSAADSIKSLERSDRGETEKLNEEG